MLFINFRKYGHISKVIVFSLKALCGIILMRANVEYKMWQKRMYGRLPYYVRKHFSQRQTFVFTVIVGTFGLLALIVQLIIFVHNHKLTLQDKRSPRYGMFS